MKIWNGLTNFYSSLRATANKMKRYVNVLSRFRAKYIWSPFHLMKHLSLHHRKSSGLLDKHRQAERVPWKTTASNVDDNNIRQDTPKGVN